MRHEIRLLEPDVLLPESLGFRTRYFDLPGLRLHAAVAGPEDGRSVILLHGFPEFWAGWLKQIGPLAAAGLRVVVPDQRGYNLSGKPAGIAAYRLDRLAGDVLALMDGLGWKNASVVGHDWGGVVAWAVAALFPERVARLAVLDAPYAPVVFRTLRSHPEQILKSAYMFYFQLPGIPEAAFRRHDWQAAVDAMVRTSPAGTFQAQDFERYRTAWSQPGAMSAMLNWYRALFRHPAGLPAHPRFEMPVQILWGERDFALGRELAEVSLALCARGELSILKGANHWIQHERAQEVNRRLLDFLGN